MQKLDRLGWAAGIAFSAYGLRIGIRVNQERFPEELIDRLPFGSKILASNEGFVDQIYSVSIAISQTNARVRRFHLVFSDALRIARTLDFNEAAEVLESDLQRFVAEFSRREVFIHAGVVAWKNRAILVPGKTFSGKSSLILALVHAGATYYSDEYAILNREGRVRAFRNKLSLRQTDGRSQVRFATAPETKSRTKPLEVGAVLVTHFKPGVQWKPRKLSPAQGLLRLLSNTVQVRTRPGEALESLQKAASSALFLEGARGEAEEIASRLFSQKFRLW